jgi:hypothetical protein
MLEKEQIEKGTLVLIPYYYGSDPDVPAFALFLAVTSVCKSHFSTFKWHVLCPMSKNCLLPQIWPTGQWARGMHYLLLYGDPVTSGRTEIGISLNIFDNDKEERKKPSVGTKDIFERLRAWPGYERHADVIKATCGSVALTC